jgi:hypothetical protein
MKGASPELKSKLLLEGTLNDYNYTKNSRKEIEGVDDAADFRSLSVCIHPFFQQRLPTEALAKKNDQMCLIFITEIDRTP